MHVHPESARMVVSVYLAVNAVGINVVGEYLERVGVHEQGVGSRIVPYHGAVGSHGIACLLVVYADVAGE